MFLASQIAELFNHLFFRKGPVNSLEFLYRGSHQGKVALELPFLCQCCQACPDITKLA